MATGRGILTTPNVISIFRIATAPVLLLAALSGRPQMFVVFFALGMFSDCVDGFLARHLHQTTPLGARLDSWGDLLMMLSAPVGVALLWPEIIVEEAPYVAVAIAAYLVPLLFGLIKYHRLPSFHTWGAKFCTTAVSISLLLVFLGISRLPFRLCVPLLVLESIQEIVMVLMLPQWHPNLPSLWHALRYRSKSRNKKGKGGIRPIHPRPALSE